jgi:diaminopimelate epimerase
MPPRAPARALRFTKMHGLGNDYIFVNGMSERLPRVSLPRLARALSDRHFGIGADGLILVLPSQSAQFRMQVFNADGSEAEMCGNGIRMFARYVYEHGLTRDRELAVETLAGVIRPRLMVRGGRVASVRVDMGEPRLERSEIPMRGKPGRVIGEALRVDGERYEVTAVSMGNPHCVIFVKEVAEFPVARVGPAIERHRAFPRRTNVEFVQVLGRSALRMRVWERGAGETLACGTGACATLVAAVLNGKADRKATVHLPGGDLKIEWRESDNHVYMAGPAEEVFSGEIAL